MEIKWWRKNKIKKRALQHKITVDAGQDRLFLFARWTRKRAKTCMKQELIKRIRRCMHCGRGFTIDLKKNASKHDNNKKNSRTWDAGTREP